MDAVFMIGNATSRVLQSPDCQSIHRSESFHCVTGPRLLEELKATKQMGFSGWLTLDADGHRRVNYTVKQLQKVPSDTYVKVTVAEFDFTADQVKYVSNISWDYHNLLGSDRLESVCSYPCEQFEAKHIRGQPCCWNCQPCRNNEYLAEEGTRCKSCPEFTWPDPETRTSCVTIPPKTMSISSPTGIVLGTLGVFCLCICVFVFFFFHRHRGHRVIKASSLELSYLMLFAITIGYSTVLMFMLEPTDVGCKAGFLLLGTSFVLIYGPLLVRTLWVFRLFEASKRTRQRPRFTSRTHQLIFCALIVILQVSR
ncbi:hypothetical protein ACOMHN_052663 [Nucella lapillus]